MAEQKGDTPKATSTRAVERQRAEAKGLGPVEEVPRKSDEVEDPAKKSRTFEYDGVEYTIDPPSEWDVTVMEGIEENHMFVAVKALLGEAQWAKFKEKRRTNVDFGELVSAAFGGEDSRAE